MSEEIKDRASWLEISHDARLYSRGDPVVRGPLCVLVPLECPSHRANRVPPGKKLKKQGSEQI